MEQQIGTSRRCLSYASERVILVVSIVFSFADIFVFGYRLFGCWYLVARMFFCVRVVYDIINVPWCAWISIFLYCSLLLFVSANKAITTRSQICFPRGYHRTSYDIAPMIVR